MDKQVKAEWVKALRSGEYEQTQGKLHRTEAEEKPGRDFPPGYCCLGVLCDLAVKAGVIDAPRDSGEGSEMYAGEDFFLPADVQDWAGLPYNPATTARDQEDYKLSELNDGEACSGERFEPFTFEQIAQLIEDQF